MLIQNKKIILTFLIIFRMIVPLFSIEVSTLPSIYSASHVFTLTVNDNKVPVTDFVNEYDYAACSAAEKIIKIQVQVNDTSSIQSYSISPRKLGIQGRVTGNTLTFSIDKPQYLIVSIDHFKKLVIAIDLPQKNRPTSSGKGIFNIMDSKYNADPSGTNVSTEAIQKAIDDASAYPGKEGIVYIPAGVFLAGNLILKSNIAIYMECGAVLRATNNPADYKPLARKNSQNRDITWWLYTPNGTRNIRIYGRGIIDGNGYYLANTRNFGNNLLVPMGCSNFSVDGILFRDSGSWAIMPVRSDHLTFTNCKLFNHMDTGEDDGFDICESQDVLVQNTIGIALDDPFSTKTWDQKTTDITTNWYGKAEPVKNVVFDGCMSWTFCFGFKLGQGIKQPQENIIFKNSVVYNCAVGIGIHHKWGSSYAKNIVFDNIDVESICCFNDDRKCWLAFVIQDGEKDGISGSVSHVLVNNIKIWDKDVSPSKLKGISSTNSFSDIVFKNIYMPGEEKPAKTLEQMNITDRAFVENITVK